MNKVLRLIFLIAISCVSQFGFSQVGINTILPLSTLDINGNLSVKTITLVGSNTPTQINDGFNISLNPQMNDQVFNLPDAVLFPGRIYMLRNINDNNTAAVSTSGGLLFYKGRTVEADNVNHKIYLYDSTLGGNRTVFVISDGINWTVFN